MKNIIENQVKITGIVVQLEGLCKSPKATIRVFRGTEKRSSVAPSIKSSVMKCSVIWFKLKSPRYLGIRKGHSLL